MSAVPLAEQLRALHVNLSVSATGKLHVEAPIGTLTDELRATLSAHRDELLATAWDPAAADTAFAATLHRLRHVTGASDERSADLWEAVNTAWFGRDRGALATALRDLETYTLRTYPPDAAAVLTELRRRRCAVTLTTAPDGGSTLVVDRNIPLRLRAAMKQHLPELIDLVAAIAPDES